MRPLKNNVIYRQDVVLGGQTSSSIIAIDPETAWIVEAVGSQVKDVKIGDRIAISGHPRPINQEKKQLFMIAEDQILAVYGK